MTRDSLSMVLLEVRMGQRDLRETADMLWKELAKHNETPGGRLNAMVCDECGEQQSKVDESRVENGGRWRRRRCKCKNTWYTDEVAR